jgi:hypothetical protein
MSNPKKVQKPEEETITLNLASFTPGHKTPPQPSADESVTMIVERAAEEVSKKATQPVVGAKGPIAPKDMLGAVTYSYAKGVYRSEDIARKMAKDPEFSAAAGDGLPDAQSIRKFRRLNREAIMETLARVFRRQRKKAATETVAQTMPGAEPAVASPNPQQAAEQPGETTILSRRDAEDQINKAAWIDNMSKDE